MASEDEQLELEIVDKLHEESDSDSSMVEGDVGSPLGGPGGLSFALGDPDPAEGVSDSELASGQTPCPPPGPTRLVAKEAFYGIMAQAAARMGVPMPPVPTSPSLEGDFELGPFQECAAAAEPMVPRVASLDSRMRDSWQAPATGLVAPVTSLLPITRRVVGFDRQLTGVPPVEKELAAHLAPRSIDPAGKRRPQLPAAKDQLLAQCADRQYRLAAQTAAINSAVALLSSSISRMTTGRTSDLSQEEMEEVSRASSMISYLAQGTASCAGRQMALSVVTQRILWLSLSSASEKEKKRLCDAPLSDDGLFGDVINQATEERQEAEDQRKRLAAFLPVAAKPKPEPKAKPKPAASAPRKDRGKKRSGRGRGAPFSTAGRVPPPPSPPPGPDRSGTESRHRGNRRGASYPPPSALWKKAKRD